MSIREICVWAEGGGRDVWMPFISAQIDGSIETRGCGDESETTVDESTSPARRPSSCPPTPPSQGRSRRRHRGTAAPELAVAAGVREAAHEDRVLQVQTAAGGKIKIVFNEVKRNFLKSNFINYFEN